MIPVDTRAVLLLRAGGRCERCGDRLSDAWPGWSAHHRRARGMGGSRHPDTHSLSNLLALCGSGTTGCHGEVERDRFAAMRDGFLVRRNGTRPPSEVPVLYRGVVWRILEPSGGTRIVEDPEDVRSTV